METAQPAQQNSGLADPPTKGSLTNEPTVSWADVPCQPAESGESINHSFWLLNFHIVCYVARDNLKQPGLYSEKMAIMYLSQVIQNLRVGPLTLLDP